MNSARKSSAISLGANVFEDHPVYQTDMQKWLELGKGGGLLGQEGRRGATAKRMLTVSMPSRMKHGGQEDLHADAVRLGKGVDLVAKVGGS